MYKTSCILVKSKVINYFNSEFCSSEIEIDLNLQGRQLVIFPKCFSKMLYFDRIFCSIFMFFIFLN